MAGKNRRRVDQRYKDPDSAPPVIGEKRMTFFVSEADWRAVRRLAGQGQIINVEHELDAPLPETPSAVTRLALQLLFDHVRDPADCSRSDEEWEDLLNMLREAAEK